jgi:hypothetical protein
MREPVRIFSNDSPENAKATFSNKRISVDEDKFEKKIIG